MRPSSSGIISLTADGSKPPLHLVADYPEYPICHIIRPTQPQFGRAKDATDSALGKWRPIFQERQRRGWCCRFQPGRWLGILHARIQPGLQRLGRQVPKNPGDGCGLRYRMGYYAKDPLKWMRP